MMSDAKRKSKGWSGRIGLGICLFGLLFCLSACTRTSDEIPVFSAPGSWVGTANGMAVQGLIAADGTLHLAVYETDGTAVGEYAGEVYTNRDSVGGGSVTLWQNQDWVGDGEISFYVTAGRHIAGTIKLSNEPYSRPFTLDSTTTAVGPASQEDVQGRWSLNQDNLAQVTIAADGTISGGDAENCLYSGGITLLSPEWKIYRLNLNIDLVPGHSCSEEGDYTGLATILAETPVKSLWYSANAGTRNLTSAAEWRVTQNVGPTAAITVQDENGYAAIRVVPGVTNVTLNASSSSDANRDVLSYTWSGVGPNGPLTFADAHAVTTTINAVVTGSYSVSLTVNDGWLEAVETRAFDVVVFPARFVDNGNGTVTDILSPAPGRVWLRDAGCFPSMAFVPASTAVAALGNGSCGLGDGSVSGDWHLPTRDELNSLVDRRFSTPALANAVGDAQWSAGDPFVNLAPSGYYRYWTSTVVPEDLTSYYYINFDNGLVSPGSLTNRFHGWPVRNLRPDETP